jgi:hypothetical protein
VIGHAPLIAMILLLGWAGIVAIGQASDLYLQRSAADIADLLGRKHVAFLQQSFPGALPKQHAEFVDGTAIRSSLIPTQPHPVN